MTKRNFGRKEQNSKFFIQQHYTITNHTHDNLFTESQELFTLGFNLFKNNVSIN